MKGDQVADACQAQLGEFVQQLLLFVLGRGFVHRANSAQLPQQSQSGRHREPVSSKNPRFRTDEDYASRKVASCGVRSTPRSPR